MKKILLLCIGLLFSIVGFSQSYEINSLGSQYTASEINTAFGSADFCGLYKESLSQTILLDDGAEVILKSAEQLSQVDDMCVKSNDFEFPEVIWKISTTGKVVRMIQMNDVKSKRNER